MISCCSTHTTQTTQTKVVEQHVRRSWKATNLMRLQRRFVDYGMLSIAHVVISHLGHVYVQFRSTFKFLEPTAAHCRARQMIHNQARFNFSSRVKRKTYCLMSCIKIETFSISLLSPRSFFSSSNTPVSLRPTMSLKHNTEKSHTKKKWRAAERKEKRKNWDHVLVTYISLSFELKLNGKA